MQCQKCNNELEADSKFCAHCGAPVPESVIVQMNDEKPITKTKVFLLKTLAFFIAAFLTFIIKLILMGAGLLEFSADFMKGGILLLLALWMLLNGFFLKDAGKKKWGFGLLVAYLVLSIAFGYFYNNSSFGVDQQIMQMAEKTPIKISEDIELSSVKMEGNSVLMEYKLLNISANGIAHEKLDDLKSTTKDESCKDESFVKMIEHGKNITVSYYGNDNNLIFNTHLSKIDCDKHTEDTPKSLKNDNETYDKPIASISNEFSSEVGFMYPLDTFTVNLLNESGRHYLKVEINLEIEREKFALELDSKKQLIRDIITRILSSKSLEDISTVNGKVKLKEQISSEINAHAKSGKVKEVYFTDFVVQ